MKFLETLGWRAPLARAMSQRPEYIPARVLEVRRSGVWVKGEEFEGAGEACGRLRKEMKDGEFCVGDWVYGVISGDLFWIQGLLPRQTLLSRMEPGGCEVQAMVANADELWIVSSCNGELNLSRLERYLAMASAARIVPCLVLTKSDLILEAKAMEQQIRNRSFEIPIFFVSSSTGEGIPELAARLGSGKTIALMGSSGVGKSSLVNCLLGQEILAIGSIREEDAKGRHTTTARRLCQSPSGACLIDTPGMRELALTESSALDSFADIRLLVNQCRFTDCSHKGEPGCALSMALEDGQLDPQRWQNYLKLEREIAFAERRLNKLAASEQKRKWRSRAKENRQRQRILGR